jgi:REP element-mobilizing transposase RayT
MRAFRFGIPESGDCTPCDFVLHRFSELDNGVIWNGNHDPRKACYSKWHYLSRAAGEWREEHHFLLTAWVFLPDHWHAILIPRFPLRISRVMEAIKVNSTLRIDAGRKESGLLW